MGERIESLLEVQIDDIHGFTSIKKGQGRQSVASHRIAQRQSRAVCLRRGRSYHVLDNCLTHQWLHYLANDWCETDWSLVAKGSLLTLLIDDSYVTFFPLGWHLHFFHRLLEDHSQRRSYAVDALKKNPWVKNARAGWLGFTSFLSFLQTWAAMIFTVFEGFLFCRSSSVEMLVLSSSVKTLLKNLFSSSTFSLLPDVIVPSSFSVSPIVS